MEAWRVLAAALRFACIPVSLFCFYKDKSIRIVMVRLLGLFRGAGFSSSLSSALSSRGVASVAAATTLFFANAASSATSASSPSGSAFYSSSASSSMEGRIDVNQETRTITINRDETLTESGARGSVILTHGLGDTASGWADAAIMMAQKLPNVKWILPTAPNSPVTLNGGMLMPSWYDIRGLGKREDEPCDGIEESAAAVLSLVKGEEEDGVDATRIVLAGFSQGGALSIFTGLQAENTFAGIVAMSGYLPAHEKFQLSDAAKQTPVLLCHGTSDPMVKYEFAEETKQHLVGAGHERISLKSYPGMAHSVCMEEIEDVTQFLMSVLPNRNDQQSTAAIDTGASCDTDNNKDESSSRSINIPLGQNVKGDKPSSGGSL